MGRHRADHELGAEADSPEPTPRPALPSLRSLTSLKSLRSRLWGNPVALAAVGLLTAIVVVFGGWLAVGWGGSAVGYPWSTNTVQPTDVMVTIVPPSEEPSPTPSEPVVSVSPSVIVQPSTTRSPEPATGMLRVSYRVADRWGGSTVGGFRGEFTITNAGSRAVSSWLLRASFGTRIEVSKLWNATICPAPGQSRLVAIAAQPLPAGGSVTVGFVATYAKVTLTPSPFTVEPHTAGCPAK